MSDYDWWLRGAVFGTLLGAVVMLTLRLAVDLVWAAVVWWVNRGE